MPPLNLNDAGDIRSLIVDPVVKGVEEKLGARIAALETSDRKQQDDIDTLKRNQSRAMWGWSGIVLAGSVIGGALVEKVKKWIGWS